MSAPRSHTRTSAAASRSRAVVVRVLRGSAKDTVSSFSGTFTVGRDANCDLQLEDAAVAPRHLQVLFDGVLWWARDLNSAAGTFVDGNRVQLVPLQQNPNVELGQGGPLLSFSFSDAKQPSAAQTQPVPPITEATQPVTAAAPPVPSTAASVPLKSETQIIERYIRPVDGEPAGAQTLMFRRAFARVQKKSSRRYQILIGVFVIALLGAGSVIAYQRHKLQTLRATAEQLFYTMKSIELETAKLQDYVLRYADPQQVAELAKSRAKLKKMEGEYDAFIGELGVYAKASDEERYILRMARRFGECEVNIPKQFVAEVKRYIDRWRSTDRFENSLQKISQKGYAPTIARAFADNQLPPQFLYLAMVESNFDDRAVGPPTKYGFAKGMWQFISLTGNRYGLQIGPLYDQAVYDPKDERFDWEKATSAAARYIQDLHVAEAQASGLLVMASYNWGEHNIRNIIASMPESPQERNFWRLLAYKNIPVETYDYVLSIFSAAVICENPRLFGFDVDCPVKSGTGAGIDERGRDRPR